MKKLLVILGMLLVVTGCGKTTESDIVKEFSNTVDKSKSYKINGTMEISNDEEKFVYNLETYYMKDNYYKVILVNQTNNHEQIILKNKNDVYVITPELNKSFKFQSEWPDNSSQSYLLKSIKEDLMSDKNVKLIESDNSYVIKSKVNYPNNQELVEQKVYFDKQIKLKKVEVLDKNGIVKIKVTFNKIDLKANLSEKDFDIKEYIDKLEDNNCIDNNCDKKNNTNNDKSKQENKNKEEINSNNQDSEKNNSNMSENGNTANNQNTTNNNQTNNNTTNNTNNTNNNEKTSSYNLDSVIYPLYIPGETHLTNSETIKTNEGNRTILTFTGEKNFVIIEEMSKSEPSMKIVPVYGEPLLLPNAIAALTGNSLTWDSNNVSYYLASTDLSTEEMLTIAKSLGNTTLVSKEK